MGARFIVFIFVFVGFDQTWAKSFEGTCKAPQPMSEHHLTPQGIQGWLKTVGSKVKTVRDFVCCLPEEYRSNYMVGHSSIAGQNGTPDSPRVIMMNRNGTEKDPKSVRLLMSLNGGQHGMNGAQSIEIAYINPQNKEAEYFDLSFEDIQKTHLSHKNPESCMNCHGDQGKAPPGGPKLIFDIFGDWARFVGGATQCNPVEDKLQSLVSEQAVKSVKTNQQYDCLDKSQLAKSNDGSYPRLFNTLADFDNNMGDVVKPQRQKWIRSLPKWPQYKYLFAAANAFCDTSKLREWVGPDTYRKNMANLEVDPRLKKEGRLEDVFQAAIADEDKKALAYRKGQERFLTDKGFSHRAMEPNSSSRACDNDSIKNIQYYVDAAKNDKSTRFEERDPMLLLFLDNKLRGPRFTNTVPNGLTRFFLEGEGYGTFFIQKSLRHGDLIHGGFEFPPEPYESDLFQFFGRNADGTPDFKKMKLSKDKTCSELKALSIHAFEERTRTSEASQQGKR